MRDTATRRTRNACTVLICLVSAMWFSSCSQEEGKPTSAPQQQRREEVDTTDPSGVAKAFWTAIAKRDSAGALRHVLPAQRSSLEKQLQGGLPPMPSAFEVHIESVKKQDRAQVQMVGQTFGLDLRWEDGRWWVVE